MMDQEIVHGTMRRCQCGHEKGEHVWRNLDRLRGGTSRGRAFWTACCVCPCQQWRPRHAKIICNRWGNWKAYIGGHKVAEFGNGVEETAEQAARRWLTENE